MFAVIEKDIWKSAVVGCSAFLTAGLLWNGLPDVGALLRQVWEKPTGASIKMDVTAVLWEMAGSMCASNIWQVNSLRGRWKAFLRRVAKNVAWMWWGMHWDASAYDFYSFFNPPVSNWGGGCWVVVVCGGGDPNHPQLREEGRETRLLIRGFRSRSAFCFF